MEKPVPKQYSTSKAGLTGGGVSQSQDYRFKPVPGQKKLSSAEMLSFLMPFFAERRLVISISKCFFFFGCTWWLAGSCLWPQGLNPGLGVKVLSPDHTGPLGKFPTVPLNGLRHSWCKVWQHLVYACCRWTQILISSYGEYKVKFRPNLWSKMQMSSFSFSFYLKKTAFLINEICHKYFFFTAAISEEFFDVLEVKTC